MTDLRQAATLALDALELSAVTVDSFGVQKATQAAITALRTALEQQAEPPPEWESIKNILDEYGLDAIAFVAAWKAAQQQADPVAWMFQHDETGRMSYVSNDGMHTPDLFLKTNLRYALVCPLYTTLPQRPWVGLKEEDWEHIDNKKGISLDTFVQGATWAEVQLRERNT